MDTGRLELSPVQKNLFLLAAIVVILAGMHAANVLLTPSLLALLIALAVLPAQQWLGHRIGRVAAYVATLAGVVIAIVAVTVVLGLVVGALVTELADFTGQADDVYRDALSLVAGVGIEPSQVTEAVEGQQAVSSEAFVRVATRGLEAVGDFGLIVLLALFMLADAVRLREKVDALQPAKDGMVERLEGLTDDVHAYLRITAISGLTVGVLASGVFMVAGVPLAPLWGLLVGLLKFVPVIGFWSALIPPVVLVTLERGLWWGIGVAAASILLNQAVEHVMKPRMIGEGLNLSPFTVIFSLVFWAFILGPLGTVLAVPLTLAVKHLMLAPDPRLRWLDVLVSARAKKAA